MAVIIQMDEKTPAERVQDNLAALEVREDDGRTFGEHLRQWEKEGVGIQTTHHDRLKCVSCGNPITMANVKYYDFDITSVECWQCQHREQ